MSKECRSEQPKENGSTNQRTDNRTTNKRPVKVDAATQTPPEFDCPTMPDITLSNLEHTLNKLQVMAVQEPMKLVMIDRMLRFSEGITLIEFLQNTKRMINALKKRPKKVRLNTKQ